eukprot:1178395-Prorocentrum_minimum.AAC.11
MSDVMCASAARVTVTYRYGILTHMGADDLRGGCTRVAGRGAAERRAMMHMRRAHVWGEGDGEL